MQAGMRNYPENDKGTYFLKKRYREKFVGPIQKKY